MNKIDFNLYLITGRNQTLGRPLEWVVEAALAGGVRAVQLREKELGIRPLIALAVRLRELTRRYGALLLVNERLDVCLEAEADGVHLRSDGLPPPVARRLLGKEKIIGVSCHSLEEALAAERGGADFITLGPLFATPSKKGMGTPIGLPLFRSAVEKLTIPVFALGGAGISTVEPIMKQGAGGIAVISALMSAEDPCREARRLLSSLIKQSL